MIFTVLWQQRAEARLADLWTQGPDRNAIAEAADEIDRLLQRDPQSRGESRDLGERILFVPPLSVLFSVDEADRKVYVMLVDRISS